MAQVSTAIILERRKILSSGKHPLKLRITYRRQQKYYSVKTKTGAITLTLEEYQKKFLADNPQSKYKKLRILTTKIEAEAIEIIESMPVFTFAEFESQYFDDPDGKDNVFARLQAATLKLDEAGQIKTAETHKYALKSFKRYCKRENIRFDEITVDWIKKYDKWMNELGRSNTTKSIYLRILRKVFNDAISDGVIKPEQYPFGRRKYQIPTGQNIKKALTLEEIARIYNYETINEIKAKCKDYWILSYLCNGMNFKDLAQLKHANVDSDSIVFIRSKTSRTSSKSIVVPLTIEIAKLLDKHGTIPDGPESYLLPILKTGMTAKEQRTAVNNMIRLVNKKIKLIALEVGITKVVTTYTARHSYATVLKRSGASIEFISESLGHSSFNTTENYLASFEMDKKIEMAKLLTQFNDIK